MSGYLEKILKKCVKVIELKLKSEKTTFIHINNVHLFYVSS